ncbi:type II toxin-antitoxin system RatA family toxin [Haliea sp. AH-315-K21]|uniref:Ubiquinone-binding protein n=1 Tax=SAR86 cluster bacterium TaxID=2030880 RepID=A0A2A5CHK7_9GAMM|nr:type II toxin-antitoxin system RatA family toxin [Haliea sp. AH-315-K21]MBN4076010.1 type II toxin-antitoxin system RatA family toxin [Gammaproteobacteria bacterium AH-315-E17]PCJ42866.1 MAG: ubiquinone-binding protein [SAR86 cluster bacterium]
MTVIQQNALLPYSAQAMFDLVNDIESYPKFMDGCLNAEVLSKTDTEVFARLDLGKAGFKYSFTTKNILNPPETMMMELIDGPFKHFDACWTFNALTEDACKASLDMHFEFKSGLLDMALKNIFNASCKNLVNAVCKRADKLYG